jgi:hypothetical protein
MLVWNFANFYYLDLFRISDFVFRIFYSRALAYHGQKKARRQTFQSASARIVHISKSPLLLHRMGYVDVVEIFHV